MARQPAAVTLRGVIRCAFCRTDEYGLPEVEFEETEVPFTDPQTGKEGVIEQRCHFRLHDKHLGVRFGDNRPVQWQVFLDGVDVTTDTYELMAGDDGWVVLFDRNQNGRYVCAFSREQGLDNWHAVAVKKWGKVEIVRVPAS